MQRPLPEHHSVSRRSSSWPPGANVISKRRFKGGRDLYCKKEANSGKDKLWRCERLGPALNVRMLRICNLETYDTSVVTNCVIGRKHVQVINYEPETHS